MSSWRIHLPKLNSTAPGHELPVLREPSDHEELSNVRNARNFQGSAINFGDRLSGSLTVPSPSEDVFYTPGASPLQHRNSASSNRIPSPARSPNSRRGSYGAALIVSPTLAPSPDLRHDQLPPIRAVTQSAKEDGDRPGPNTTSVSRAARSNAAEDTNVVKVYPTRNYSKRYLASPTDDHEMAPWDKALDFDLGEFSVDTSIALPDVIIQHLEQAAQQYHSDASSSSQGQDKQASGSQGPSSVEKPRFHFPIGKMPGIVEESHTSDNDAESDLEDDRFCCRTSKMASMEDDAISYCYECRTTFCERCWRKERAHRRKINGHDRIDRTIAQTLQDTLGIDISEAEQAKLHLLDECASWFGAIKDSDGVVFRDFGRYASLMADHTLEERKHIYPALVSFVGDTGAGKSSLVKLLVGFKKSKNMQEIKSPTQTPVVGSNGAAVPTSGDVHLYADPDTFFTERPLLYADCEGLQGGTLDPVGMKRRRKLGTSNHTRSRTASFDKYMRRRHDTAERDITWATTPEKSTRKFFVEHLYPRLLYTFSDVIVLVVKNARATEGALEQLVIWADAVIETASNQLVLPHAIIVLNASDNTKKELWDVDASTEDLLSRFSDAVNQNPRLQRLANKWNARGFKIKSVQSLLLTYYSSVRVIRIPDQRQPSLVHDQIQHLYDEINKSAAGAHDEKHKKRVKLNAEALQPYLQRAFDHFCSDLNDPFDFIKASFADSGIPSDFSGNILKLAVNIMNQWQNKIDGSLLFRELSFMVASCVMLDAVRNTKLGTAGPVFKLYLDHFDETLDDFGEKVWPCEFVTSKGRCVNVKAGHTKGHQLKGGQILAPGSYESRFTADTHRQKFRNDIFANLQELLLAITGDGRAEHEAAAEIHESQILRPFYNHIGGANNFVSHSVCLSCIVSPAEHCLPCGHVICTQCAKDFGTPRGPNEVEMKYCPLHRLETVSLSQRITFKPESAGVRVLSMDGGGVRGVLLLKTLLRLEQDLGGRLPIASFFDLVIGTSTGAIIGLGMVEMGWSVKFCLKKFEDFASTAFHKHKMLGPEYLEWLVAGFQHGRYKVEPLEDLLRREYTERNLFGGAREDSDFYARSHLTGKVGVTTTTTNGTPYLLANYNRLENDENTRYSFLRSEKPEQEIKVCEAARATSAAPKIFKPYGHVESGHTFIDGGVYFNNPIEIALQEQALIWPQPRPRLPDIVLSLGTGYVPGKLSRPKQSVSPAPASKGPISYYKHLLKIAVDHVKSSQKSEDVYHRVRQHYNNSSQAANCFFRFNMPFEDGIPKPDDVRSMPFLMKSADDELVSHFDDIRRIANRLIASSFYFEPTPDSMKQDPRGSIELRGHIRCRFTGSHLEAFGDLLKSRCQEAFNSPNGHGRTHSPCFVLEDRSRPQDAAQVVLSDHVIRVMTEQGKFNLGQITVSLSNPNAESDIYLRFGSEFVSEANNSISGFPRYWDDRRLTPMTSRLNLSEARGRFPSRRRPDWSEPTKALRPVLGQYATEKNPGLASDEQMRAVSDRLNEPAASQKPPQELEGGGVSYSGFTSIRPYASNATVDSARDPPPYMSPQADYNTGIHSQYAELPGHMGTYELADTSVSTRSPNREAVSGEGSDMYGDG
ncbi:hypothetical protein PV11_07587 [Exophiala sideris]|uniref:PNPLA domain-containing protein n=1 Tax=Exophiala sideris TaxID=1016849 RepID=A0A0D1YAR3_9EURO|nr:hypothetical protein PV11_07587 [Exophiala sideris]